MAERRMFAKTIIDSDAFIDMPLSTQALYFHLSMRADDEGFINNPRKIQRMIGAADDDLKVLITKKFIIPFESGIVVIKHWKIHNYIQKDRFKETVYIEEKSLLETKDNNSYTLKKNQDCIQIGYTMDTQDRIGKGSIDKISIDKDNIYCPAEAEPNPCVEIISRLNELTGSAFRSDGKATKELIKNLLKEYTKEDILMVVDKMCYKWGNDAKMSEYLRPSTLFRRSNFENYYGMKVQIRELTTDDFQVDTMDFFKE